jgi:hypothetical protein
VVSLSGTIDAPGVKAVTLQRRAARGWRDDGTFPVLNGRYEMHVGTPGIYRVKAGWAPGPALRVFPPKLG